MSRIRSPGYPNASLEHVIENADKIHSADRQHPVDRETAARHIGFGGLSGSADRALSALLHFGLMEKVKKGEIRITDLALRIIHPTNPEERRIGLHEAAFNPELFKELRQRYPETPPSRESLSSYLSRSGFATAAIPAATKAYLESCYFLQRERAYDLSVAAHDLALESVSVEQAQNPKVQYHETHTPTIPAPAIHQTYRAEEEAGDDALNKINMDIRGHRVMVSGLLDLKGLRTLEKKIVGLKALLAPDDDLDDDDSRMETHGPLS